MNRLIFLLLLLIPVLGRSQYIMRSFNATITFGSFSTVNDSTFRGDITVNDQTNTYYGTDISVGDIVFTSSGRSYRVGVINTAALYTANVDLVDIQDSNYASPTGTGQISIKTSNYGFLTFTPDNANGISQQAKSILETHNWNFLDSILPSNLDGNAFNLAAVNQYLISDRLVSGRNLYDLKIDSIPLLRIHADEIFMTDDSTTVIDWISTTNRYLKRNAGVGRVNSLGQDYVFLQNTDGTDNLSYVWAGPTSLVMGGIQKETSGTAILGPTATFTPTGFTVQHQDSLAGVRGRLFIGPTTIRIDGTDSLLLALSKISADNTIDTVLAIKSNGRVMKRAVNSIGDLNYSAGNGAEVTATGTGVTFTRTTSALGTFNIPSGVDVKDFRISHSSAESTAIGATYKIRFVYAGSIGYNNSVSDLRLPTIEVANTNPAVLNGGVANDANRIYYASTTGVANLEKSITGLIGSLGYFEVTLDSYDDAIGSSSNASEIVIRY